MQLPWNDGPSALHELPPDGFVRKDQRHKRSVGLAYGPSAARIAAADPDFVDYLEIPFELLDSNPAILDRVKEQQVILHCASLSIAGTVRPASTVIERIGHWLRETRSPWLGEHLAFLLAERSGGIGDQYADPYAEPYNIGFTVAPPMNEESVHNICEQLKNYAEIFSVPILVENSPIYFDVPGTDMDQVTFLNEITAKTSAGLLLDLTHLVISATNQGFSARDALDRLPLDRIVEVHVSGIEREENVSWDHHASPVPGAVLSLIPIVAQSASLKAITLEYNWISEYSDDAVRQEVGKIRDLLSTCS